jgi:ADP-heptose:LPS heptosyltransferase
MSSAWEKLETQPLRGVSRDAAHGAWSSVGRDSLLRFAPSAPLDRGWYCLEVPIEFESGLHRSRLFWDAGQGFDDKDSVLLPPAEGGRILKFCYFPSRVTALALNPAEAATKFGLGLVRIRRSSNVSAALTIARPYVRKAFRSPRLYARFGLDLVRLLAYKGLPGLRGAVRELVSTQSAAALLSYVSTQVALARHRPMAPDARQESARPALGAGLLERLKGEKKGLRIGIGLVEHFGDIVACEPVARHLRKRHPDAEISWVVRAPYRSLIDHNPHVDRTIAVDCLTDWIKWRSHDAFDRVVDLHVNGRICQACRIPLNKTEGNLSIDGDNHLKYGSLLQAFCLGAGLPALNDAPRAYIPEETARSVDAFGLPEKFAVVHCVSISPPGKDWQASKWDELARRLMQQYELPVVEVGLDRTLASDTPGYVDLTGRTDLLQMAEVIRRAAIFIGIDSGPAHFANALSTPSVILLGKLPHFEKYNPYSGEFAKERGVRLVRNDSGSASEIEVNAVFEAARTMLRGPISAGEPGQRAQLLPPESASPSDRETDPRLIAFYLPQYHPIPENDRNWGKGFTEWRNVGKALPFFEGQYQPRLPGELGYYDLRIPEILEQQAELAREHGIHGFCYYFYWFDGRRLLNLPLDNMLARKRPDFPFCFCWANENWTRRWDGMSTEIIVAQKHTPEDDRRLIRYLLPIFDDPRYIRVDGKPLFIVYRTELFPDPLRTAQLWREEARKSGVGDLYLVRCEGFDPFTNPESIGFDASYEVPMFIMPDALNYADRASLKVSPQFKGRILDYAKIVDYYCSRESVPYRRFRDPMLAWDNTPRHGQNAVVFHGTTPALYQRWLEDCLADARANLPAAERIVFINAWNEWAEGSYLEPDLKFGHSYLEATREALARSRTMTFARSPHPGPLPRGEREIIAK